MAPSAENDALPKIAELPLGVVVRKSPGATRWARWVFRAVAVLPGAGPAFWRELRSEGGVVDYHAATATLTLHRADTEAYLGALAMTPPSVWAILRPSEEADDPMDVVVHGVTASPYEAQDYLDSGEEIVEAVPMPAGLVAWVRDFTLARHVDEPFKKRRRRDWVEDAPVEDGVGDARIRQDSDVYRAPGAIKRRDWSH